MVDRNTDTPICGRALLLASCQAAKAWQDAEGTLPQASEWSIDHFERFLKIWKVTRNSVPARRPKFLEYLKSEADWNIAEDVVTASDKAKTSGWTPLDRSAVSLVSKFAFYVCYKEFAPIDRYSLEGMNEFLKEKPKIKMSDYNKYMKNFQFTRCLVASALKSQDWSADVFTFGRVGLPENPTRKMDAELFSHRVADKYLMILGRKKSDSQYVEGELKSISMKFSDQVYDFF